MKIGILSDTHNQIPRTMEALKILREENVRELIHCGDMTRVETAELFQEFTLHHVFGNNDIDEIGLRLTVQSFGPGSGSYDLFTAELEGKRVAAIHGHQLSALTQLIQSQRYDYVFHGHTHRVRDEKIGKTRVVNPGSLGGARRDRRNFCILELATGDLAHYSAFD